MQGPAHCHALLYVAATKEAFGSLEENVQSKEALERELEQLGDQIDKLEMGLEQRPEYGLGKGDPLITRWELNRALLENLKKRAASVRTALAKLDRGTYGICERCGRPIHADRMAALPEARLCIDCAREDAQTKRAAVSTPKLSARRETA